MRRTSRTAVVGTAVAVAVVATVTTTVAAALDPDGLQLRGEFAGGGQAWLELEDRNVVPAVCFIWESDRPQDGDGIASRILTAAGAEVVDLGIADQWAEGDTSGCELVHDDAFRDVFAHPEQYLVEVRVVEEQGTAPTPPLRTGPLRAASS